MFTENTVTDLKIYSSKDSNYNMKKIYICALKAESVLWSLNRAYEIADH